MSFVIEESGWHWDENQASGYVERIERLLDRCDIATERGEPVVASTMLFEEKVHPSFNLAQLIWDEDSPLSLPHEVLERINTRFGRIRYWDEHTAWPAIDVDVNQLAVLSPSIAFAHSQTTKGNPMGCLSVNDHWRGPCKVVVGLVQEVVHFIVDETSHRCFFRQAFNVSHFKRPELESWVSHAYPDLFFLEGVFDGLSSFEGGYNRVKDDLHNLLAILDDHGKWVFLDKSDALSIADASSENATAHGGGPTNQIIEQRFKRWGLVIAPEKPNVWQTHHCRAARERVLKGRVLYCHWHYKFQPHTNRLHLHPPVPESENKVIVAIMAQHLPLPND